MDFKHHDHHATITGTILPSSTIVVPTSTISVDPPGGTGHPTHSPHFPAPTHGFPRPTFTAIHAGHVGHTALWVFFALFTLGLIGIFVLAQRVERRARIFHWLSGIVVTIAMVTYFALAAGLGHTYVPVPHHSAHSEVHIVREVFYGRYIDWLLTTPLLLASLSLLAGLSPYDTTLAILADIFFVVTGLLSTLTPARSSWGEKARWGFYAVSLVGFLFSWKIIFTGGLKAARHRESKTRGLFLLLGAATFLVWLVYPIVSAVSETANKISVDSEIIVYGVLDVIAKLGFTYFLLLVHVHGEDDTYNFPEWFVEDRVGHGHDGRGGYGSLGTRDE